MHGCYLPRHVRQIGVWPNSREKPKKQMTQNTPTETPTGKWPNKHPASFLPSLVTILNDHPNRTLENGRGTGNKQARRPGANQYCPRQTEGMVTFPSLRLKSIWGAQNNTHRWQITNYENLRDTESNTPAPSPEPAHSRPWTNEVSMNNQEANKTELGVIDACVVKSTQ